MKKIISLIDELELKTILCLLTEILKTFCVSQSAQFFGFYRLKTN